MTGQGPSCLKDWMVLSIRCKLPNAIKLSSEQCYAPFEQQGPGLQLLTLQSEVPMHLIIKYYALIKNGFSAILNLTHTCLAIK